MTAITTKNFKSQLNSLVKSTTTQRDKLQALIEFGFDKFAENGDTTYLTMAMCAVMSVRSFRTETLKNYITDHCPLKFMKEKNAYKFKKLKNAENKLLKEVTTVWYEHDKKGEAVPDIDVIMRAKNMLKMLNGETKGHIKDDQGAFADILKKHLGAAMDEIASSATAK